MVYVKAHVRRTKSGKTTPVRWHLRIKPAKVTKTISGKINWYVPSTDLKSYFMKNYGDLQARLHAKGMPIRLWGIETGRGNLDTVIKMLKNWNSEFKPVLIEHAGPRRYIYFFATKPQVDNMYKKIGTRLKRKIAELGGLHRVVRNPEVKWEDEWDIWEDE